MNCGGGGSHAQGFGNALGLQHVVTLLVENFRLQSPRRLVVIHDEQGLGWNGHSW
jgi:hypothetical protein